MHEIDPGSVLLTRQEGTALASGYLRLVHHGLTIPGFPRPHRDTVRLAQALHAHCCAPGSDLSPAQPAPAAVEDSGTRERSELIDTAAAANILGVTGQAITARARRGTLPGIQLGRVWLFPKQEIELLAEQSARRQHL